MGQKEGGTFHILESTEGGGSWTVLGEGGGGFYGRVVANTSEDHN